MKLNLSILADCMCEEESEEEEAFLCKADVEGPATSSAINDPIKKTSNPQ